MIEPGADGALDVDRRPTLPPDSPPAAHPWPARVRALLEVFACSGLPTQLLIGQALALAGVRPFGPGTKLDPLWVSVVTLGDTMLIAAFAWMLLRANGESPRTVFLGTRSPSREIRLGVLLTPPLIVGVALVLLALRAAYPPLHNVLENPLTDLATSRATTALFLVVALVGGGVREELQRAFLLTRFERYLGGPSVGLVLTSVAFGAGHAIQGWDAALVIGLIGLVWGWLYLARRSVVAPMVSHAAFNLLEIVQFLLAGAVV